MEVNTLTKADFDFTPPPGALLTYDAREPDADSPYQSVPGGEEMLDRIADWIRTMYPPQKMKTTNNQWGWFVGGLVFPIIISIEILKRRNRRKY
jgi:hypothetical protein